MAAEVQGRLEMDRDLLEAGPPAPLRNQLGFRVLEMRTYWVSHLNSEGDGDSRVSRRIRNAIRALAEGRVLETPSLYVFDSFATIDHIAMELRFQRRVKDGFIIGSFTHSECRFVGACDETAIQDLVPYAKRAGPGQPSMALGKSA